MFVVKRTFRDASGMIPAGSIVEPVSIKRFKHRLLEGHIVEVNEQNFDKYADFFKQRYGIDLPVIRQTKVEQKAVEQPKTITTAAAKSTEVKKAVAAVIK